MSIYSMFETDKSYEKKGIQIRIGTNSKGEPIEFTVARAGGANTVFAKRMEAALKPYRRQIQTDTMDDKVGQDLILDVFCNTVILGWSGVEDRDDNPIEFSVANCKKLMQDLPDLFQEIREQASNASLFRQAVREEDAKN